ncbi:MAG TPA: class I SAM-dependent methyltransferase [Stellaceae bacterium]|nr:class I SAM-dependent methyltransferase [Stellaceae bacterium]
MTGTGNPGDRPNDSKDLWEKVHSQMPNHEIALGRAMAAAYVTDPKMVAFVASRYKFVAKMIEGADVVLEVGCGDGFGAPLVAQTAGRVVCTDIHTGTLEDNRRRLGVFPNIEFQYFDFRLKHYPDPVAGVFAVDVLEHIYPTEEQRFLANIAASLTEHGIGLFGTPNAAAEAFASPNSRLGHVNLKDHKALKKALGAHFHNVFIFSMNDEVIHTGYYPMAHYLWALCVDPRR